ncbi:MAG: stage II sporulation protein R [Oscillospiraceae bacterium]|nr:stage II sporulation protein R [Oscillospiraceae bacterium]
MKIKKIEIALIAGMIITVLTGSMLDFGRACDDIRNNVYRLHILANSDGANDQELKLAVRDRILRDTSEFFRSAKNYQDAEKNASETLDIIESVAADEIAKQGFEYDVSAEHVQMYFTTRTYEDITLPAGNYNAVQVTLGEGTGKNWWCVLYPPLCVPAARKKTADKQNPRSKRSGKKIEDVLSPPAAKLTRSNPRYEPRFAVIELYDWIKSGLKRRK